MKYLLILFAAMLLGACTRVEHVNFIGTTPNMDPGAVFMVKNIADSSICGGNINAGKFNVHGVFENKGYYNIVFSRGPWAQYFDIYIEDGDYNITYDPKKAEDYPKVQSSSKKQQELSAYYRLSDSIRAPIKKIIDEISPKLSGKINWQESKAVHDSLVNLIAAAQQKELKLDSIVFNAFADRYPDNTILPHILANMNYQNNPVMYYKVYQKLSSAAKNTDEGEELGERLPKLVKLSNGQPAPPIAGTTIDGKPFDLKALHKKIVLVEIWKAGSRISRLNHEAMITKPLPGYGKDLGIVSISLDDKRDWWTTSVKDDKITWTQVSDLKGNDSPNIDNWGVEDLPFYCLIDGNGRIIEYNVPFTNVAFRISDYLQKH